MERWLVFKQAQEKWDDLRLSGKGDGSLEIPSKAGDVDTGYGPVRYALGPQKEPRLLVPCGNKVLKVEGDATDKLSIAIVNYKVGNKSQPFIDLLCLDQGLTAVFGELVDEIIKRIGAGENPAAAVGGAIGDFRKLLTVTFPEHISRQIVIGLLGELYVLRTIAQLGNVDSQIWLGPWEQRHDFRQLDKAVEVKTTSRSDKTEVHINGIDQLKPPAGGELVLVQVKMEQAASGSIFLSGLVEDLENSGVDKHRIVEGILLSGCKDPNDSEWNRYRFEIQDISAWQVREGFPRITSEEIKSESVPAGIDKLTYQVDLSVAESFKLNEHEFDGFLKGMLI
jgi:hypothetical protein